MTDLDDALNSSAPLWHPVEVIADWYELPPNYPNPDVDNFDSLKDLGQQVGPDGYVVNQSLDDGLPNPVTMTTVNNASGSMAMDLVGRSANVADVWGWRTDTESGTGSSTAVTTTLPTDSAFGDYSIVVIAVNSAAVLTDNNADPGNRNAWELLSTQADGAGLTVWVWGREWYTGGGGFVGTLSVSAAYSWVSGTAWARTANGSVIPLSPGTVTSAGEGGVAVVPHSAPPATLNRRGWMVGAWASVATTPQWSATGTDVEVNEVAATVTTMLSRSAFKVQSDTYTLSANTSGVTSTAVMIAIPLEVADRPEMNAMAYFSQFNRDSPIVDFERDIAPVTLAQPVVTPNGIVSTQLFEGQMAGVDIKGRLAEMQAISHTRIALDKSLVLPTVYGTREGCTVDWLATYLMAHGGQHVGVAPTEQTRIWVPFYGSLHPFLGGNFAYPRGYEYVAGVETFWRPPTSVPGPFVKGMYAQQQEDLSQAIHIQFDDQPPLEGLPGMSGMVGEYNDMMSQANNKGRMTVWLRGDPSIAVPTSLGAFGKSLFEYRMEVRSSYAGGGNNLGGVQFFVLGTGQIQLKMGDFLSGYATLNLTPEFLPFDGEWHFLGITWDWALEEIDVRLDNTTWNTSAWTTNVPGLPVTEAAMRASGGYILSNLICHIPISEFQVEVGPNVYTEGFTRFWPTPAAPSQNAIFRPTDQWIEVIADATPVQGWATLAELAQASLSHYRTNESDNMEFLPLSYFGEAEQMTPSVLTTDTDVNASELDVARDPTKTRNVVTLEYDETRVDTLLSNVLTITSSIMIPRGVTDMIFSLDVQSIEVQGALAPYGLGDMYIKLSKLSSGEIATPSTIPTDRNYMTVNTKENGTGINWNTTTINARIIAATSATVTIQFTNGGVAPLYLANNGQDVPFLRILGYAIRATPAYTTSRDVGSVATRHERALTSQMPWIQRRTDAEQIAGILLNILSRPRDEVFVQVMGDPRRKPGQMVTLADAEGTRAEGTWRILSIRHRGNGAMFIQGLQLVRVLPIGVWDGPDGWDNSSWGE